VKFWFVSRETLEEAKSSRDRMIERLEREILELKEDRKVTVDILSVRALGRSIYGKIEPPKEEEPEIEQEPRPDENGELKKPEVLQVTGRARSTAKAQEAANLKQYIEDQEEIRRLVETAKEEGRLAALAQEAIAPTNGNGNHS